MKYVWYAIHCLKIRFGHLEYHTRNFRFWLRHRKGPELTVLRPSLSLKIIWISDAIVVTWQNPLPHWRRFMVPPVISSFPVILQNSRTNTRGKTLDPVKYVKEVVTWNICMPIHFWFIRISLRNKWSSDLFYPKSHFWSTFKLIKHSILIQFELMKVDSKWNFEQFMIMWLINTGGTVSAKLSFNFMILGLILAVFSIAIDHFYCFELHSLTSFYIEIKKTLRFELMK